MSDVGQAPGDLEPDAAASVTVGVVLIGDEILSGRTVDANLAAIARHLAPYGVQVGEARIVGDDMDEIGAAVTALRARCTYVFTTGGIGPTHDDITADAVAAALGLAVEENPQALAILADRYAERGETLNAVRRRMARMPVGARLISNPVSGAPGFEIGNVFVMAGVPAIVRGMLQDIGPRLKRGAVVFSATVTAPGLREGDIGAALGALQEDAPSVSIGSYPYFRALTEYGVQLVARSADRAALEATAAALVELVRAHDGEPGLSWSPEPTDAAG